MYAQDIRFNDSIPLRYGMKYALNNLPGEYLKQSGLSEDSLKTILLEVKELVVKNDSMRIMAPDLRFTRIDAVVYEQPIEGAPSVTTFDFGDYEEDGALLFSLLVEIKMKPNGEETYVCKRMTVRLINQDPSFLNMDIRNVRFELSPIHAMPFSYKRPVNGPFITVVITPVNASLSDKRPLFRYDFKIEGDIYAERLLSDGSVKAGLLYKFYGTYKDGKAVRKIVPVEFKN